MEIHILFLFNILKNDYEMQSYIIFFISYLPSLGVRVPLVVQLIIQAQFSALVFLTFLKRILNPMEVMYRTFLKEFLTFIVQFYECSLAIFYEVNALLIAIYVAQSPQPLLYFFGATKWGHILSFSCLVLLSLINFLAYKKNDSHICMYVHLIYLVL